MFSTQGTAWAKPAMKTGQFELESEREEQALARAVPRKSLGCFCLFLFFNLVDH